MNSYSQHGEDRFIFDFIEKKDKGVYIDIGAGMPKHISNTYMLYELGWRGLLIEPCPLLTLLLRKDRPDDEIYEGAVLDREGTVDIVTKGHFAVTKDSWIYETHKATAKADGHPIFEFTVPCTTLPKLLEKLDKPELWEPDFISIDIDGNEGALLSTVDFNKFKPKLILIETGLRQTDQRDKWGHYLTPYYYIVKETGSDAFYLRKKEKK